MPQTIADPMSTPLPASLIMPTRNYNIRGLSVTCYIAYIDLYYIMCPCHVPPFPAARVNIESVFRLVEVTKSIYAYM